MTKFSFKRKLTDYTKVQAFIGTLIRGNSLFFKSKRIKKLDYLDIGCGVNTSPEFVNLDYFWNPKIDICWNLSRKRLPFPDNRFDGIYSEHCFEHISYEHFRTNMKEIYRILKPGATFRLIMPDGEIYLDIYQRRKNGEDIEMPYEEEYISTIHRINGIFRNHGHKFIYDYGTIQIILKSVGFTKMSKEKFNVGADKKLLKDTAWREVESLYVEVVK